MSDSNGDAHRIRLADGGPLPLRPSEVPVPLSHSDLVHVLWGDPNADTGGGHFWAAGTESDRDFDRGIPGNTEFPERWDEEGVRQAVERTLLAPELARYDRIIETLYLYREDDDVLVFAVLRRRRDGTWRFVTSFPLNGRGVVRNHPLTGESEPMPLDREVWTTYPGGDE